MEDRNLRQIKLFKKTSVYFFQLYKKCVADQKIYNGEFNRMKKFYRQCYYNHNFSLDKSCDCGFVCRNSNPLFDKYHSKIWQYFFESMYKKTVSLKPFIKSGKRPVSEDPEYKQKLIERAKLTDLGQCPVCHRYIEIENNVIYDHGFTIGHGFRNGVCFGANFEPWERSKLGKERYVEELKKDIALHKSRTPDQSLVDYYNSDKFKWTAVEVKIEKDNGRYIPEIGSLKTRDYLNRPIYNEAKLSKLQEIWQSRLDSMESELNNHVNLINNWKAVPTLRELAQKQEANK